MVAWIAHFDTSPETSGHNVKPIVHRAYAGCDILLPGDPGKVIHVADNPELDSLKGCTLVTTDGTTLLGADDKAGLAVIMETAAFLMAHPERVYSREQLLERVRSGAADVEPRTVDVQIRRLRAALEPAGVADMIETVRGSGYRFSPQGVTR